MGFDAEMGFIPFLNYARSKYEHSCSARETGCDYVESAMYHTISRKMVIWRIGCIGNIGNVSLIREAL